MSTEFPTNADDYNLHEEIAALKTVIRRARRTLLKKTADPLKTGLLISRTSNTLITLLQTQQSLEKRRRLKQLHSLLKQPN